MTTATLMMEATLEVARKAGDVALGSFQKPLAVETKIDGTPVTRADRAAEAAALDWLHARFPEDGVLSEESGQSQPASARQWVIDPIDGTKTFIRGVPMWATLVALIEDKQVIAGAAYFPALGETIVAAPGAGAWWNGARCRVSNVGRISEAAVLTTDASFPAHRERVGVWRELSQAAAVTRTWGDAYGYLLVATGRAEVMVDDAVSLWDVAALKPAIEEAGGVFTDWRGQPTPFGGDAIATNSALAATVRRQLGAMGGKG